MKAIRIKTGLVPEEFIKTTEIYTHITQRGLGEIKSPLDQLDIKIHIFTKAILIRYENAAYSFYL